ncbi:MAG TPA: 1-deoxy-D-xylulose-5-phosphate reductoisomerase [Firmicutes bacterium]|jgi:1-deoxy-D-xylulose-5-phosphate reductoisomerase|nr:1-deoxy-D-xylulose-5-phosphate reductoisomerase [Bacillota bacterium]
MARRRITILGSTGSIGTQTLRVIEQFKEKFEIAGLSTNKNIRLLEHQINKYGPSAVTVYDEEKARELKKNINTQKTAVLTGDEGLIELVTRPDVEMVVVALVGFSGFKPTLAALKEGKDIALANKEALVVGGELIMAEARSRKITIKPIDSEHSAIFQCLNKGNHSEIDKIILTASGGPFWGWPKEKLFHVTPAQALEHPNWNMGSKISIDSATLMNKGFEVIEARWLFNLDYKQIDVVIHPESIIHSMVEFIDGSILAQMGLPDMLLPIQYALTYPERWGNELPRLKWKEKRVINFIPPDHDTFPCLNYAYKAGEVGGTLPAVMNAANEVAVEKFLQNEISFLHIPVLIEEIMNRHVVNYKPSLEELVAADRWAREETKIASQKLKGER